MSVDPATLLSQFQAMASRLPQPPRARDAAEALGTSEGALTEARRLSGEAVALGLPQGAAGLLADLARLGPLMALARNPDCVLEIEGRLAAPQIEGTRAHVRGLPQLDLDLDHWAAAYRLTEETRSGRLTSLQVFDRHGDAVLKLYPAPESAAALDALAARLAGHDAPPVAFTAAPPHAEVPLPEGASLPPSILQHLLEAAATRAVPMRIAIANRGCRETFAGHVETIKPTGAWLNVLDPGFNMHLRADRVAHLRLLPDEALVACRADGFEIVRFSGGAGWGAAIKSVRA